jgi:hypothetical protein
MLVRTFKNTVIRNFFKNDCISLKFTVCALEDQKGDSSVDLKAAYSAPTPDQSKTSLLVQLAHEKLMPVILNEFNLLGFLQDIEKAYRSRL